LIKDQRIDFRNSVKEIEEAKVENDNKMAADLITKSRNGMTVDSPLNDKLAAQQLNDSLKKSNKNLMGKWFSNPKKDESGSNSGSPDLSYHVIFNFLNQFRSQALMRIYY
jgi:hypothetical protein